MRKHINYLFLVMVALGFFPVKTMAMKPSEWLDDRPSVEGKHSPQRRLSTESQSIPGPDSCYTMEHTLPVYGFYSMDPEHGFYSMGHNDHPLSTDEEQKTPQPIIIQPKAEMIPSQGGCVEANGLKITIPQDAVKVHTQFSIKPAPLDLELPQYVFPVTAAYEVEPHNVEFNDLICMDFTLNDASEPVALFVQKEKPEDKKLKKWLVIEPKKIEDNVATFEVRSFSFSFVGKMNLQKDYQLNGPDPSGSPLPPVQKKFQDHNIIRPGLNYRALCEDSSCLMSKEPMIINLGFGKFFVADQITDEKLKCNKCEKILDDSENVKQVILFQAIGEIKYTFDKSEIAKGAPKGRQSSPFTAMGDRLVIYGETGESAGYQSVIFEVSEPKFNSKDPKIAIVEFDPAGNPIGTIFDLGMDGAFSKVKLLIGNFFGGLTKSDFKGHIGKALDEKGFAWKCTKDEDEFLRELPEHDIAWVISFNSTLTGDPKMKNDNFPDKVIEFHQARKGLMLWEDNDSIPGHHTTATLQKLFGMTVEGNDLGQKIMVPGADCSVKSTFSKTHPIMTGIKTLYPSPMKMPC